MEQPDRKSAQIQKNPTPPSAYNLKLKFIENSPNTSRIHIPLKDPWNFAEIDNILASNTNYSTFKIIEVIQSVVLDHIGIKLHTNTKNVTGKPLTIWKLNNTFVTSVKEKVSRKIKNIYILNCIKIKIQHIKICGS